MMFVRIAVGVTLLSVVGCASGGSSSGPTGTTGGSSQSSAPHNNAVITQSELEASATQTAYDAIARLRPNFLAVRGTGSANTADAGVAVYLNDVRVGGTATASTADALKDIYVVDIRSIQYLSASEATQRFGTGNIHGAILITRKK
jgi:hypothetical protein